LSLYQYSFTKTETVFVYNDFVTTGGFSGGTETITMSYIICRIFKSRYRNYVMPTYATHEENGIEAQNPNHAHMSP